MCCSQHSHMLSSDMNVHSHLWLCCLKTLDLSLVCVLLTNVFGPLCCACLKTFLRVLWMTAQIGTKWLLLTAPKWMYWMIPSFLSYICIFESYLHFGLIFCTKFFCNCTKNTLMGVFPSQQNEDTVAEPSTSMKVWLQSLCECIDCLVHKTWGAAAGLVSAQISVSQFLYSLNSSDQFTSTNFVLLISS